MMCFSKGLGAPVGSILVGAAADSIRRARRARKRWGGGMRQVGILAAACLHALDHHVERLADDHRRARRLADGLARRAGRARRRARHEHRLSSSSSTPALDRDAVLRGARGARRADERRTGPRRLRAITHLDVDDAGIERAIAAFQTRSRALAAPAGRAARAAGGADAPRRVDAPGVAVLTSAGFSGQRGPAAGTRRKDPA